MDAPTYSEQWLALGRFSQGVIPSRLSLWAFARRSACGSLAEDIHVAGVPAVPRGREENLRECLTLGELS